MISIIMPEHKEEEFVDPMLSQIEREVPYEKEVIIVTSSDNLNIYSEYNFPIKIITEIKSSGAARNEGAKNSEGDVLFFTDCHCCFDRNIIDTLLHTLQQYPNSSIVPGVQPVDFPSCARTGGIGYGVFFDFTKIPFRWRWIGKKRNRPYIVPFGSACAFMIRYNIFAESTFGFIEPDEGVGFEEEIFMRLAALGYPTILEPSCAVAHLFKKTYPVESTKGYIPSRAAAVVINVFNSFDRINKICRNTWGITWDDELEKAFSIYGDYSDALFKRRVKDFSERWFFRTK